MGDSETAESDTSSPRPHGRRGALQHVSSGGKFAASSRESSRRSSSSSFFRKISNSEVKYHAADEKPKIVRDYIVGKLLGEGSYAKVKEAVNLKSMRRVALKIFNRRSLRRMTGGEAAVQREIIVLKPLKHENIVELVEDFIVAETDKLYLALEYMGGGTLQSLLERAPNRRLPPIQARKFFVNMVNGLKYLHKMKIVHRDLKPDNLLLTSTGDLKISDFGCAGVAEDSPVRESSKASSELPPPGGIGSPAYQAPELVSNPLPPGTSPKPMRKSGGQRSSMPSSDDQLIYKADIWSAGIVLYVMIVGEFPFPNKNNLLLLFEDIAKGNYVIPSWIQDAMLKDLLKKLLTVDPAKRISIDEIMDHPWLEKELPRQTPIPIDPAPSSFGHDSRTVEATAKKLRKQLEQEAKERAEMNGGLEEDEDDSDDGASFSRGRMVMTRSIDDLRNRSRATSRNPSKTPPRSRESDDDSDQGNYADEFSRSSSLSASDSSSGKGPSRDRVRAGKRKAPRGDGVAGSATPSPKPSKRPSQRQEQSHSRNGSSSPKKGSRQTQSSPNASPSSTSHSNATNTDTSSEAGATGQDTSAPALRDIGRSRSLNRKCSIM